MSRNHQLTLVSVVLVVLACTMIYLGYKAHIWPPALTGFGFLLLVWGVQLLRR